MHIVCPNCSASYQVSASAIGTGRSVRCVRCRTMWHQEPVAEVPPLILSPNAPLAPREAASEATVAAFRSELGAEQESEPAVEATAAPIPEPPPAPEPEVQAAPASTVPENGDPAGPSLDQLIDTTEPVTESAEAAADAGQPVPALSDITIPVDPSAAAASGDATPGETPDNIENTASRRRGKRSTARRRIPVRSARMPAAILMLACVVAALIVWRGTVVRHAPQMASLYAALGMPVNLRGLVFTDVAVSRDTHDGIPVLIVEGTIASTASKSVEVPRLRFAMRNEAGGEVYAWTAMPAREVLAPGETLPFKSRLASPPGEGRDVTVRFFNRLDAVAGLR